MHTVTAAYHWWRGLGENPVYLREKGVWGKPNPFYERLAVFMPFIIVGGVLLGLCVVPSNLAPLALANDNNIFFLIYCLLCLPTVLLQALTWFGLILAPALTATTIGREIDQGNWDILRLTPQSVWSIVWAKLLGGLARLRIWPLIWLLSLIQALAFGGAYLLAPTGYNWLWAIPLGIATLIRPSLEIFLAGLIGITVSIWVRSAIMALATTYGLLILFKLVVTALNWMMLSVMVALFGDFWAALYQLTPTIVYLITALLVVSTLALSLRQWL